MNQEQKSILWIAGGMILSILFWGTWCYVPSWLKPPRVATIDYPANKAPSRIPVIKKNKTLKQKYWR